MAPTEPSVDQLAAFEQMREQVSPTEINREMLMTAEQADPVAVAEFRKELAELEVAPEVIDMLNTMVDEVLANPNEYPAIRQKYLDMGVDEEILPEAFDAGLFAALNIALDELRGPENMLPPQGFARGGIASLNPMARGMAEAGRYGDTMLAHISPVEAQILRRYGGSGTINPVTGMPEFFLKKMFKKLGKAVKKFANTTIGKIVIGTALFMVAGPAAASMLGASAGGAAAAGISGFVSGAGTSLLAGGNLKDSLKAGAIGGITAGVSKGVMNRMSTPAAAAAPVEAGTAPAQTGATSYGIGQPSPITRSGMGIEGLTVDMGPGAAPLSAQAAPFRTIGFQGDGVTPLTQAQFDRAMQAPIRPSTSSGAGFPRTTAAPGTLSSGTTVDLGALDRASPTLKTPGFTPRAEVAAQAPSSAATVSKTPGFFESIKNVASPAEGTTRMGSLKDAFLPGKGPSVEDVLKSRGLTIDTASALDISKAEILAKSMANNAIRQYAPLVAGGLGIMALGGGFEQEEVAPPAGFEDFMSGISPGQRLLDQDPQRYGISYGGVGTTASTPQYRPYSYTPPPTGRAKGGSMDKEFPRKTGPINGPGTGTSDDIPAMLSDGEFVFTAKAVRNMGDGSRRKGAQRMYALMRKLEGRKNG
jgi:hypothetical protein